MASYVAQAISLLTSPQHTRSLVPLMLLGEAILCGLIILYVPYTEIDWSTYMVHVSKFLQGEYDYTKLTGPTGPCVYPAIHVYLHSALFYVTDQGKDVLTGQIIFAVLYLCTIAFVVQCYRRVNAPPWLLIPLVLSKRLHSIFLLRLFNDCWATLFLWASIYLLQSRRWEVAALVWGLGLGTKMTLLLAAPGLAFVLVQGAGAADAFSCGAIVFMLQTLVGWPFMMEGQGLGYLRQAFDLGRQFLYKWTVNWRFVSEEVFLSKAFASGLLVLHLSILVVFAQTKWITPSSRGLGEFVKKYTRGMNEQVERAASKRVTPVFVMDTMLGSAVIGLLCARSLHYQFYAYLGWASPYLLWRAGGSWVWVLLNWSVQEYCWLVYPSTEISSMLVVFELAMQVLSILIAPPVDHTRPPADRSPSEAAETQPT